MTTILDTIVARKHEEVDLLRREGVVLPAGTEALRIDPPRGFRQAILDYAGLSVIAEAKKASPSKGVICADFDPVKIAENYERSGAQCVSVLTDRDFFQGDLSYMMQVRDAVKLPVIRKDFIIDELQIQEAARCGADAILLIVSILNLQQLQDFQACATELGMDCLVEVHDAEETDIALQSGANLIGVNNRNLKDFSVDIETSFSLRKMVPDHIPMVSESGLQTAQDLARVQAAGMKAVLIGETLMRMGTGQNVLESLRG